MREILFRGKRIDNGEWVYGQLWVNRTGTRETTHIFLDDGDMEEVEVSTVGQYTGLKDRNGVKIFEGDVVECISTWDKANMVVIFEDGEYRLVLCDKYKNYTPGSGYYSIGCFDKNIIGNIHDNQEAKGE